MPTRLEVFTEEEVRERLKQARNKAGSMMALAEEFGMNDQFLGRVAMGRDMVSANVAEKLGFRRQIAYVEIAKSAKKKGEE